MYVPQNIYTVFHQNSRLLASERSEQDTIRGVQIRAGAVYVYICGGTCGIIVVHATHIQCGRS